MGDNVSTQAVSEWLAYEEADTRIYHPRHNEFTGSPAATIVLSQLHFWWARGWPGHKAHSPFYKFKQPPKTSHPCYKDGDSWIEELSFSRREFDTARGKLGRRIESTENWQDILARENILICWWTDQDHKTWYALNEELYIQKRLELYQDLAANEQPGSQSANPPSGKSPTAESAVVPNPESAVSQSANPPSVPESRIRLQNPKKETNSKKGRDQSPNAPVTADTPPLSSEKINEEKNPAKIVLAERIRNATAIYERSHGKLPQNCPVWLDIRDLVIRAGLDFDLRRWENICRDVGRVQKYRGKFDLILDIWMSPKDNLSQYFDWKKNGGQKNGGYRPPGASEEFLAAVRAQAAADAAAVAETEQMKNERIFDQLRPAQVGIDLRQLTSRLGANS